MVCCVNQLGIELVGKEKMHPLLRYSTSPLVITHIFVNVSDSERNINTRFGGNRQHVSVSIAPSLYSPL